MKLRKRKKNSVEAILLSMPALIVYSCVIIYPILSMFVTSFYEWNGVPDSPKPPARSADSAVSTGGSSASATT